MWFTTPRNASIIHSVTTSIIDNLNMNLGHCSGGEFGHLFNFPEMLK